MTEPQPELFETILRQCAAAAPRPWYPKTFVDSAGVQRDALDAALERLRLRGLIELTEWVAGHGQGYQLTPEGERVLHHAGLLAQVRAGKVPPARERREEGSDRGGRAATPYERGEAIREALLGASRPYMTQGLIALNVLVFVAGLVLSQVQNPLVRIENVLIGNSGALLHQTGSLAGLDLLKGQWWRLLTCCFVHFGLLHLGVNMYSLYVIGPLLERMWGHVRFLILYLLAGLGGSCLAMILRPVSNLAGASGALWGVLGSMVVWVLLNRRFLPGPLASNWLRQLLIVFVLNVFITFAVSNISKEAHFGGGAVGALVGVFLVWQRFGSRPLRWLAVAGLIATPLLCLGALHEARRFNVQWEQLELERYYLPRVARLESDAVQGLKEADVDRLLAQNAQRRDPAAVDKAVAALARARAGLEGAQRLLRQSGPYRDPDVVEARQARLDYLAAQIRLFELAERELRDGEKWTEKDEQEIREQEQRLKDARKHYDSLVQ
jgi:membrane associated rhomboid family serine protease